MDEIQLMLTRSADAVSSGNFKDAYFCYLDILDATAIELRKVKFIANVAITSTTTASLISITRSSVVHVQDILSKHNAAIAAISEPAAAPRKTSLSRHSGRITSGQTKTVTMLTEQLQATASDLISSNGTSSSSGSSVASPPQSQSRTVLPAVPSIPPKPTRRPPLPFAPPTPTNRSPVLGFPEHGIMPSSPPASNYNNNSNSSNNNSNSGTYHGMNHNSSNGLTHTNSHSASFSRSSALEHHHPRPLSKPAHSLHHPAGRFDPPPQSKPPLPPKPARLFRKLPVIKTEDNSSDEEESDDDDSDDDDDDDDDDLEGHVFTPPTNRRASSPSIAIPTTRRPGTPLSVPTSPTLSPSSISSSISSADRSRMYTLPQYSSLSQSHTLITVIPDGSVDPTNLVEAERIGGDNDDQLDQKTYGPSDHIPLIPFTPLRTTHRTLVEKEKTYSTKLAETKLQLQEKTQQLHSGDTNSKHGHQQQDDDVDAQTLQENLTKYTSMIANVMATITKVRELLYRSASVTSILEFPAYLVAYQLTLVESVIFLEIPPSALLTHSPKTPHRSITASTDFFNYLTRMIEYSVLYPLEASGRAQSMHYWVKVAVKLHELENFQTLKAVLSALGTPPIKRLKRTWSFVPRKSMHKFETLSELMSEARNYGKYREMMNSLNAGTMLLSPSAVSPIQHPISAPTSSKQDMLSLNGVSNSLSNLGFRSKEAARRPMVPFLGTFIMDITYLLAAVKKSNNAALPISSQIPATSSLREKSASMASPSASTPYAPEDDIRIQDLLMTLTAYQSGPKYSSQPPRSYIKAATKSHHHFRAPSLTSALHRTAKYRTSSVDRQIGANITHQSSYEEEDDDVSGSGLRPTQQLILHYLLTRPWVPERMVDELSTIREPPKNKSGGGGGPSSSASSITTSRASAGGTSSNTTHSWPLGPGGGGGGNHLGSVVGGGGGGSMYSQISTTSTIHRGSTGSNSGDGGQNGSGGSSRPTSVDE
ncbi:DELLA protein rgl2 [Dissophora globulifera]|uniref:DELLA protein rgl2 n=1 Tax=Dissophora globulifera TaxID=979702 RepID=A0A9P6US38_9FUNG|nr:DELLA protein rgl2 [Dissophora globulifera]